ncbi:MFS transporter [Spirochaetia bacterium 38H-sp]|uniref:MFS transporter n=1 Tax=Rarispira pelagica TaxID=3141764 RepID=A0ABU9UBK9_9SPIR
MSERKAVYKRLKTLQFLYFFSSGSATPFYSLYLRDIITYQDGSPAYPLIGLIISINGLMGLFSSPIAGYMADKLKLTGKLISLFAGITAIGAALMASLPLFKAAQIPLITLTAIGVFANIIMGLASRPIVPLIDTETMAALREDPDSGTHEFGNAKWFSSLGWATALIISGTILHFAPYLFLALATQSAAYLILSRIAIRGDRPAKPGPAPDLGILAKDRPFQLLVTFIIMISIATTSSYSFTSYIIEAAGGGYLLMGIILGLGTITEIPLYRKSSKLLKRYGNIPVISIGVSILALKLIAFVLIMPLGIPVLLFFIQLLHGIGYSLYSAGTVHLIDLLSHHSLKATYQSLYQFSWAAGSFLGSLFAGFVVGIGGSPLLMGLDAMIMIVAIGFAFFIMKPRIKTAIAER